MKKLRKETLCVQAGYEPKNGEPRIVPIIQGSTFKYDSSEEMGKLFDMEKSGYFYSRIQNPTCDNVAAKICALEGGSAAILTSSGQTATFFSIFNICGCGDHVIVSSMIYGGTYNLFHMTMGRMGVEFTFLDPDCSEEELDAAFKPNTKAVFGESVSNPALVVLDIEKFAKAAHKHGVPLIVDNSFPTPLNCRPFEWGADIVVHSTSKYMDGHDSTIGGCVIDSGNFNWDEHADKYPSLTTPDPSYHGVIYTKHFGREGAYISKMTAQIMRDLGAVQSPMNAYILNLGLESLAVRIERHCSNAMKVASFMKDHDKISWVNYPGLEDNKYSNLVKKYMPDGTCGVISFGVKGGRKGAEEFMKHLNVSMICTHAADAHSIILHPASSTHRQLNDEELVASGVTPDLIRICVGIENVNDIIEDIDQALSYI
ncbi:O-acetylhomoserine (thiol)-lyase [Butyrivibrio hungatei]|uniref:O-acetylhomoserine (Thiol)-lyase n=2 Tax=Lachnospiraceae TaxID=186803 RepID=A0A1G5F679_9FIRM|nr:O-acetylhomoserine (thiol)-lyase [Butyrivibrio hungatei]